MRLKDKVIVITGAASGMGLAMTQRFSREGAKIVAGDWNQERLDAGLRVELVGQDDPVPAAKPEIAD